MFKQLQEVFKHLVFKQMRWCSNTVQTLFKQGMTIPVKILRVRDFTYHIILDILPVQYYCLDGTLVLAGVGRRR